MGRYDEVHKRSLEDPEGFWAEAAEGISWYKKWDKVLDDSNPPFYRWFKGGKLNTCYNCDCIPNINPAKDMNRSGFKAVCSNDKCFIRGGTYIEPTAEAAVKKWNGHYGDHSDPRAGGMIRDNENLKVIIRPNYYTNQLVTWT